MYRIALQAGHQNITENCYAPLQSGTGAPGEMEFTVAVRDLLSQILINHGFQLYLMDANANCDPSEYGEDYDLFLAIHYDSNTYNGAGGGFAGAPDPSVDYANDQSQAIAATINQVYFPYTGVPLRTERIDGNVLYYYMWQFMSSITPCVLVECGTNVVDNNVLSNHQEVATGLAMAICKAFNVPFNTPSPQSTLKRIHDIVWGNSDNNTKVKQIQAVVAK